MLKEQGNYTNGCELPQNRAFLLLMHLISISCPIGTPNVATAHERPASRLARFLSNKAKIEVASPLKETVPFNFASDPA